MTLATSPSSGRQSHATWRTSLPTKPHDSPVLTKRRTHSKHEDTKKSEGERSNEFTCAIWIQQKKMIFFSFPERGKKRRAAFCKSKKNATLNGVEDFSKFTTLQSRYSQSWTVCFVQWSVPSSQGTLVMRTMHLTYLLNFLSKKNKLKQQKLQMKNRLWFITFTKCGMNSVDCSTCWFLHCLL